jgi:hypothetical protein
MSDQSEQQSPFRSRRFILSVLVVGVIALCAVIVLISNLLGGEDDGQPGATSSTTSSATPTSAPSVATDPDPSACGLGDYETSNTLSTAPGNDWELVGTVAAPTDPDGAGPGLIESSGFRSCYAHTGEGALFAATNFVALGTDETMADKLTSLVAPGEGREAAPSGGATSSSSFRAQVAGFTIGSYDGTNAVIDLAINYSDGQLVSLPIKLLWSEGDWKVVLSADGSLPIAPAPLESLGGYIPWAGA